MTEAVDPPAAAEPPGHLPLLDGARGLAALAVVVDHMAHYGFMPGITAGGLGGMGVLLFYVLSGFLMAFLYLHRPFDARGVRSYAVSRGSRVLPLFYAAILGGCFLFVAFGHSGYSFDTAGELLRNVLLIEGTGVLWSVPVELHFYVLFLLLWFGASAGRFGLVAVALIAASVVLGALAWSASPAHRWIFYYVHVFLAGCAVARAYRPRPDAFRAAGRHPAVAALAWLLLASTPFAIPAVRESFGQPALPLFLDPVAVGYPIAFLLCALMAAGPFRVLSVEPLRWLGGISYSLYLLHMPILYLLLGVGILEVMPWPAAGAVTLFLLLAIARVSVLVLERPAQAWLKARLLPARGPARADPASRPAAPPVLASATVAPAARLASVPRRR